MTDDLMLMKRGLADPRGTFRRPSDVTAQESLTREQKIAILRRWESDERALAVAEEENMAGGEASRLADVLRALRDLGQSDESTSPTKHGG